MLHFKYLYYVVAHLISDAISPHSDLTYSDAFELRNDAPR